MSLVFSSFWFWGENIFMDRNFLLSFLHRHFKLILTILKTIDSISLNVNSVSQLFDFKLFAVMLNQSLFFGVLDSGEINCGHFVLKSEFLDLGCKCCSLCSDLLNDSFNVPLLINELLIWNNKHIKLFLLLIIISLSSCDLLLKSLLFFLRSFTLSSWNFSFHLLNLIFSIIQKFLLSLSLLFKFVDTCLQVTWCW